MGQEHLIVDIETVPDSLLWTPPPGNPGFPPAYAHKIICIGWMRLDQSYGFRQLGTLNRGEPEILEEFSDLVESTRPILVTFNGRNFDLPVIALRSLGHGVQMAWYFDEQAGYHRGGSRHIDLCDWLAGRGAIRFGSLDALARLIGLPGKLDVDGSQIEGLFHAGRIEQIENYCLSDVAQTALLFLRFQLLKGMLDRRQCQGLLGDLLDRLGAEPRLSQLTAAVDESRLWSAFQRPGGAIQSIDSRAPAPQSEPRTATG